MGDDAAGLLNESRRLLAEAMERVGVLEGEYGRLNALYTSLRSRYIDAHIVWEQTMHQNEELRIAIHNLGGESG